MFGLWKKPRPSREQLLSAIPVQNRLVRQSSPPQTSTPENLGSTVLRLTAPLTPSRLRGLFGRGDAKMEKSFDLDELGAFVWNALDGRRTVEDLIHHFADQKRVNLREAEVSVLAFLKTLTQRNLVALAVPGAAKPRKKSAKTTQRRRGPKRK